MTGRGRRTAFKMTVERSITSVLVCVFARRDDHNAATKQARIQRIRTRPEERERRSVEYQENRDKVARVGTDQQIRDARRASNNS